MGERERECKCFVDVFVACLHPIHVGWLTQTQFSIGNVNG